MLHWLTGHIEDAADEGFGFLAGERSEPFEGLSAPPSKPLASNRASGRSESWHRITKPLISLIDAPNRVFRPGPRVNSRAARKVPQVAGDNCQAATARDSCD
jgi:hypothetical protein